VEKLFPGHDEATIEPRANFVENLLARRSFLSRGRFGSGGLAGLCQTLHRFFYPDFTVPIQRGEHDSHSLPIDRSAHLALCRDLHSVKVKNHLNARMPGKRKPRGYKTPGQTDVVEGSR